MFIHTMIFDVSLTFSTPLPFIDFFSHLKARIHTYFFTKSPDVVTDSEVRNFLWNRSSSSYLVQSEGQSNLIFPDNKFKWTADEKWETFLFSSSSKDFITVLNCSNRTTYIIQQIWLLVIPLSYDDARIPR